MKKVGKPYAGKPHVRFDEKGLVTPALYSTPGTLPLFQTCFGAQKADFHDASRTHSLVRALPLLRYPRGQCAEGADQTQTRALQPRKLCGTPSALLCASLPPPPASLVEEFACKSTSSLPWIARWGLHFDHTNTDEQHFLDYSIDLFDSIDYSYTI